MESPTTLIVARWIAPMRKDQPALVLTDSAIAIRAGRIFEVDRAARLRKDYPDARVVDLGKALVLPAFVNAHVHLELSSEAPPADYPGQFVDWLLTVRQRMQAAQTPIEESAAQAMAIGIAQCLKFGVATVGDVTHRPDLSRPLLARSPLRAISYGEVLAIAGLRNRFGAMLERAIDPASASPRLRVGISPHAPYTVDLPGYCECVRAAATARLPLATHLAENPFEEQFLRHHQGPFIDLWKKLELWQEPVETFAGTPVEMAERVGMLHRSAVLAHVNYANDEDLQVLRQGQASVVYCPRTHHYFQHAPHRWRDMLKAGINVAIGTDSCASSPDLNIVDDLRLLRCVAPDVRPSDLWSMITWRGAHALGWDDQIGSILPNFSADLVSYSADSKDPLAEILDDPTRLPSRLWISGQSVESGVR